MTDLRKLDVGIVGNLSRKSLHVATWVDIRLQTPE